MTRPLIISHRGLGGGFTENTLAGFQSVLSMADGIEFDLHITQDNHVVVHHDFCLNLESTRDRRGHWITESLPLRELTLKELQSYDVGRLKPGSAKALRHPNSSGRDGLCPPTFKQVLQLMKEYPHPLWVDIKSHTADKPFVEKILQDLQGYPHQRIVLMSFNGDILRDISLLDPLWSLGYLTEISEKDVLTTLPAKSLWNTCIHTLDPATVLKAQRQGHRVAAWTVNSDDDIHKALAMNLYAITTDYPAKVRNLIP